MKNIFSYFFLAFGLCGFSQSFNVDTSFISNPNTWLVSSSLELPGGKILITGSFNNYLGQNVKNIARLDSNGNVDNSFLVGSGPNGTSDIHEAYLCSDGKILLGGNFNSFNGVINRFVTRLNANGTVDSTFSIGNVFSSDGDEVYINSFRVADDGKIYIAGRFQAYYGNGTGSHYSLIRLNSDGSLDTSFNPFFPDQVYEMMSVVLQEDGKIVMASPMLTGVRRLNYDGSVDSTFTVNNGIHMPFCVYLQDDGKIVVGGVMSIDGEPKVLLRLNEDGSLDETFTSYNLDVPEATNYVRTIVPYEDGFLIGGSFGSFGGSTMNDFAAVNSDGTVDSVLSFEGVDGFTNTSVSSITVLSNNKILISGSFSAIGNTVAGGIARLTNPLLKTISFEENKRIVYSVDNTIQFSSGAVFDTLALYDFFGRLIDSKRNLNTVSPFISLEKSNQVYIYNGTFVDGSSFKGKIVH